APASESPEGYMLFARIAKRLGENDYILDEKHRAVSLSEEGVEKVQKDLGIKNLYSPENVRMVYHLDQALKAQILFKRDKDYVVSSDGEVIIVDEFTGRLMHGRRYNEGLHQAIEAKESVTVQQESMTLATISFQNYFRRYRLYRGRGIPPDLQPGGRPDSRQPPGCARGPSGHHLQDRAGQVRGYCR
ncbi:MAG: hypothetical protein JNG88_19250, partial [Phycisphaerales bacterium]|nr:hypothetical protein [Phycisphaerales bacterium]